MTRRHEQTLATADTAAEDHAVLVDGEALNPDPLYFGHVDDVRIAGIFDAYGLGIIYVSHISG